jgi:hypothetical protein
VRSRSGLNYCLLRLSWPIGVPASEGKTRSLNLGSTCQAVSHSGRGLTSSSRYLALSAFRAVTASGINETGRPLPVFVVSRMQAPVRVADQERRISTSPPVPDSSKRTYGHLRPNISPGRRPVSAHTIQRASSRSPRAASKKRARSSAVSVGRSFFTIRGGSALQARLYEITLSSLPTRERCGR